MIKLAIINSTHILRRGWSKKPKIWNNSNPVCFASQKLNISVEKTNQNVGQPTSESHPHLLKHGEVVPGIMLNEFVERRDKLVNGIISASKPGTKHIVVLPSATTLYMSDKIPYVFRQNTDFRYLTGCLEPDSSLIIQINKDGSYKTMLLVRPKNKHSELWEGPRTGVEVAPHMFGIDESHPIADLLKILISLNRTFGNFTLWYDYLNSFNADVHKTILSFLSSGGLKDVESPRNKLHELRLKKSPAEQALLRRSCEVASRAIESTIKVSCPGMTEHQLFATVDYHCRMNGAEQLAYPPVVASGNNANTIHYINNTQMTQEGQLVLMDAGCELHGYCSDITRTWPISGKFTDAQRTLYEIVLEIQLELIKTCDNLPTLDELYNNMWKKLVRKLREAHVIEDKAGDEAKIAYELCPHHVSHYLGMDVHDTPMIPRTIPIQEGFFITVEPGIYVSKSSTLVRPEFRGCGIRIEDDILITSSGPEVLSTCPKSIEDLYQIKLRV